MVDSSSPVAYLGLDIGGTGAKAGVFNLEGELLGLARRGYAPDVPTDGQAEIDIEEIYVACRDVVREAVMLSGVTIGAMAVSSQGQTFVSLDADDRPLHKAIMWYDSRAAGIAERLNEAVKSDGLYRPSARLPRSSSPCSSSSSAARSS